MRSWHRHRLLVRRAGTWVTLAAVLSLSQTTRAADMALAAGVAPVERDAGPGFLKLTLHPLGARPPARALSSGRWAPASGEQLQLDTPLSLGVEYLHLALTGGDRSGLLPFLRISTTSFAGFRIRF